MVIDIEKMFNFNYRFSKIKTVIINFNSKRCFQREVDSLCLIEIVLNRLIYYHSIRLAIEEGLHKFPFNLSRSAIVHIRRGIVTLEGLEVQLGEGRGSKYPRSRYFQLQNLTIFSTLYTVTSD